MQEIPRQWGPASNSTCYGGGSSTWQSSHRGCVTHNGEWRQGSKAATNGGGNAGTSKETTSTIWQTVGDNSCSAVHIQAHQLSFGASDQKQGKGSVLWLTTSRRRILQSCTDLFAPPEIGPVGQLSENKTQISSWQCHYLWWSWSSHVWLPARQIAVAWCRFSGNVGAVGQHVRRGAAMSIIYDVKTGGMGSVKYRSCTTIDCTISWNINHSERKRFPYTSARNCRNLQRCQRAKFRWMQNTWCRRQQRT